MSATAIPLILECIDGKDAGFKTIIPNDGILVLGNNSDTNEKPLHELANDKGSISFENKGALMVVDVSDCPLPVKINGSVLNMEGNANVGDVVRIGDSIWRVQASVPQSQPVYNMHNTAHSIRDRFTNLIGLEELKDFKLKNIFSEVFKKHSLVEMEEQLSTGTMKNIPAVTEIEIGWAKPWLFSRLLLLFIVLTVAMIIGFRSFENENIIPGLIFVGTFAVPFSALVFFLELNAPRNISIFIVVSLLFTGGVASLLLALVFFSRLEFMSTLLGASAAGIIEESAKILLVGLVLGRYTRYKWILNGLLFGAAIGTGFAAFESAGYAFKIGLAGGFDQMVDIIVLRGMLAPFMHIVWTANAGAALWIVKGDKKFEWSMLKDMRFLRVMISSMLLHMIWNAPFGILPIPIIGDIKYPILGIIAYIITFRLVQQGLVQLNEARRKAQTEGEVLQTVALPPMPEPILQTVSAG